MRGLYVITSQQHVGSRQLTGAVEQALIGGAVIVQYRDKRSVPAPADNQLTEIHHLCRDYGALLVINDDVELARRINADGVHLGRDDMDPGAARECLGSNKLIGVSCYGDIKRVSRMDRAGADYIALGRFYASEIKPEATPVSVDVLRQVRQMTSTPLVAIGGITTENGAALVQAGADMLAVVNGVFAQPDITSAARDISALFHTHINRDEL